MVIWYLIQFYKPVGVQGNPGIQQFTGFDHAVFYNFIEFVLCGEALKHGGKIRCMRRLGRKLDLFYRLFRLGVQDSFSLEDRFVHHFRSILRQWGEMKPALHSLLSLRTACIGNVKVRIPRTYDNWRT